MEQAVRDKLKVNIKSLNNNRAPLNKIGIEEGKFYGFRHEKGKLVKTAININKIKNLLRVDGVLKITYSVLL